MKTILFIAPHLSTGGLPQYLFKKIDSLKNDYIIYLIEYEDITGGVLVVQKNKIKNIIGDKLITIPWGGDKNIVIKTINDIKPDIIHFEEMPEYFMSDDISKQIYTSNRKHKIFETCHDSSFDPSNKRFKPDKFILVSNYQIDMLKDLNIPSVVVEYPIEYKDRPDRTEALEKLGLDPNYKHVLHVGLFTPRKNQEEFFRYAKHFENDKIIFHSVGNMADNFKWYWEPLINNIPKNVIVHGEKTNVDDYYSAMDLFLFTSMGTISDKETMPIVIREAISWNIPTLIYNLPVYQNYFNDFKNISYLEFNNFDKNINNIELLLFHKHKKDVVIISTYPKTQSVIDITLKSIIAAKELGYDVILTSHTKIPDKLQEKSNYVIYDSNNLLTHHDYYTRSWYDHDDYRAEINLSGENNHIYHGPAVYTNYYNGIHLAKSLGYTNAICTNFDMILTDENVFNTISKDLKTKKGFFNLNQAQEGSALRTVLFGINIDFFISNFPMIKYENDYSNWKIKIGSESNGLENMFYHNLKKNINSLNLITDNVFYELLKNCEIDICSCIEYFTVLPIKNQPSKFSVWFSTSNLKDSRDIIIEIKKDDIRFDFNRFTVTKNYTHNKIYNFESGVYKIILTENREHIKTIKVDLDYMNNKLRNNGLITLK